MAASGAGWPCVQAHAEGCVVSVSVVPNAHRTELDGLHDGALRVRLAAPPVEGRANRVLQEWLADQLGLRKAQLSLLRGASSRRKQLLLRVPADAVQAWLLRSGVDRDA